MNIFSEEIKSIDNLDNCTSLNKKLNIQIKIDNFHKLSDSEVNQIVCSVLSELDNIEITSINADENNIVNIEFELIDFNLKEFMINYLREKNDNIKQIASELNFTNCKEIEYFIGKSYKIKKKDVLTQNENNKENEHCFVCFEPYIEGEYKRELPNCKHFFHKKCIDKWLKKKAQCPICRDNVLEEHIQQAIFEKAKQLGINLKKDDSKEK